ncbi:MAG: TlpA family protein disulfide reductase [Marinilabiliaceae bacterium]|nr:TlpA family protein disulfide reductase [Marinilabiliaceae bacterium]
MFLAFLSAEAQEAGKNREDDVLWRNKDVGFVIDIGDDIPVFGVETINGEFIDNDMFANQVVIFQFLASWCPYGKEQMVALSTAIQRRYPESVSVICVSEDDEEGRVLFEEMAKESGLNFSFVVDDRERLFKSFASSHATLPRVVIFGKRGKVIGLFDEHNRRMIRIMKRIVRYQMK